jgi:Ca2+-transporting ATPase
MSNADFDAHLRHGAVIARATPTTKHRIVQRLQHRGEVVAVTGDGANDAPALAAADVGIALGRRGADLARATADLVLTDDAYPTVVAAIAKGRNITAQLRRAVAFYLGAKLALVAVLLAALAAGLPSPFQPVHIVLLEIFMDLGASVAFVVEPAAPQAMHRPPRPAARGSSTAAY